MERRRAFTWYRLSIHHSQFNERTELLKSMSSLRAKKTAKKMGLMWQRIS